MSSNTRIESICFVPKRFIAFDSFAKWRGTQKVKSVRRPGIEPGASEWESEILPLNHHRYNNFRI